MRLEVRKHEPVYGSSASGCVEGKTSTQRQARKALISRNR